jgi:hypothetical protein
MIHWLWSSRQVRPRVEGRQILIAAICLSLFFISPAFYRLKSKGYSVARFIIPTVAVSLVGYEAGYAFHPGGLIVAFAAPAGLFVLAKFLPPKKGAPGEDYLRIVFACPECGQSVTFGRESEGRAELCPKCGELIAVPSNAGARASCGPIRKPALEPGMAGDDLVVLQKFLNPMQAEIARQRLETEGVPSFLPDRLTANAYPSLPWASGGVRLMVPAASLAQAQQVLNRPEEETRLPDDFIPPPAPPEPESDGRLVKALLYSGVFLLVFPFLLVRLWVLFVPLLFPSAVQKGIISASLSRVQAFQISSVIALVFVVIAFFLESGRKTVVETKP